MSLSMSKSIVAPLNAIDITMIKMKSSRNTEGEGPNNELLLLNGPYLFIVGDGCEAQSLIGRVLIRRAMLVKVRAGLIKKRERGKLWSSDRNPMLHKRLRLLFIKKIPIPFLIPSHSRFPSQ